jgi:hypothetical protein
LRGITIIIGSAESCVEVISQEEIDYVIFCIDNNFISWDSTEPYKWNIQGKHTPLFGRYTLRVYAYTKSGKIATDEMDIILFTLAYQYRKW